MPKRKSAHLRAKARLNRKRATDNYRRALKGESGEVVVRQATPEEVARYGIRKNK